MSECPIPKELLIHNCVLNRYVSGGVFGNGELCETVNLENVRCRTEHIKKAGTNGERIKKSGVLYYDCERSLPEETVFLEDGYRSEIVFGGETYAVTGVKYIYGAGRLHHLEVALG